MKQKRSLYISRKNIALWLTVLCLLSAAVVRVVMCAQMENFALWRQILWPVLGTLWLTLCLVLSGEKMLYKSAVPVWLLGGCWAWQFYHLLSATPLIYAMVCGCLALLCVSYTSVISGWWRGTWILGPVYAVFLAVLGYIHSREGLTPVLADYILMLGMLVMLFAIRVHKDGKYHPTWGDRAEGRLIRSTNPIDQIGPYIMVNRTGSNNMFSESVEISELERYVRRKRREGMTSFGMTHVIIAAYVRTIAKYPALNRFVAGQKVYSRGEDIALSMTVKKELSASSPDTVIKAHLNPHDTIFDVYNKFNAQVEEAKNTPLESGVDNTAGLLMLVPGIFLKFVVWLLKTMDYFGKIPGFLLEISPFHGSAYFTSMGSLGIRPVYHHLYDFGTIPVFCAFGRKRRAEEIVNGEITERKYVDLKFNLDERICDGYYYAAVIKHFMRILSHPEVLDQPPQVVEQDVP